MIYVHLKNERNPREIAVAVRAEEEGTTMKIVLYDENDNVVASFATDDLRSWWPGPANP